MNGSRRRSRERSRRCSGRGPTTTGSWCGERIFTWAGSSSMAGGIPTTKSACTVRTCGRWLGGIHAKVHVEGKVGRIKNYYLHTPYHDISHQIRTVDRYSGAFAEDMAASHRPFRLFQPARQAPLPFFERLPLQGGVPRRDTGPHHRRLHHVLRVHEARKTLGTGEKEWKDSGIRKSS